jgi:hypothetical protein
MSRLAVDQAIDKAIDSQRGQEQFVIVGGNKWLV